MCPEFIDFYTYFIDFWVYKKEKICYNKVVGAFLSIWDFPWHIRDIGLTEKTICDMMFLDRKRLLTSMQQFQYQF